MAIITMKYGDRLICDPCYIKNVSDGSYSRFDALRTERVLWDNGDGEFGIWHKDAGRLGSLGVDSGRIWLMKAEFDIAVAIESGSSGHILLSSESERKLDADGFTIEDLNGE